MASAWSTDVRWAKLRQSESRESLDHVSELRKVLHTASDESDDEWLAQLERDYASARKKYRPHWSALERALACSLIIFMIVIMVLVAVIVKQGYGFSPGHSSAPLLAAETCQSKGCIAAAYGLMQHLDEKVDPCEDFYGYVCGNWLKNVYVPVGHSKWTAFHHVSNDNLKSLKKIMERKNPHPVNPRSVESKVKSYYSACMNKSAIEQRGAQPLWDLIRAAGSWKITNKSLTGPWTAETWNFEQALGTIHKLKSMPLFYMFVSPDDRNSSQNIIQVQQSGISLSDREYYFRNETTDHVLIAYKKLMVQVGTLLGGEPNDTATQMQEIFRFEKKLAELYEPKEMLRDTEKAYHKMTVAHLQQLAPAIPWIDYMNNMFSTPVMSEEPVVVYTPSFLKNMSDLVIRTDRRVLANYMVWHLIKPLLGELSKPFREASLELLKVEKGLKGGAPPWRICVTKTNSVLGFATGSLYIREHAGKNVKKEAEDMIKEIKKAFEEHLPDVRWMDADTRERAIEKARAMFDMIGYPRWIEDPAKLEEYYENLTVGPDNSFENYLKAKRFFHERTMSKRGKTVDRYEWHMSPVDVNAYYNSPNNYIAFPSGILQRPFFDQDFPASLNYGGIGVIMGHELTHGFDDRGRLFDKEGNMVNWWKNQSVSAFKERTACMVEQYGNYSFAGQNVNGKITLGENIADNGGLRIAYKAFKNLPSHQQREVNLPGFQLTPEQLFFIGFAQVWCAADTTLHTQHALLTDVHSPERVRVVAAVSNSLEFSQAFQCPINSTMNPPHKCRVW